MSFPHAPPGLRSGVRHLDGLELVHALRAHGLYPVSGHAVFQGTTTCTCAAGATCTMPAKHPVGQGWTFQTPTDAEARLTEHPSWNIGHLTGSVSRTVVIDIDHGQRTKPGGIVISKTGYAALATLEGRLGALPQTVCGFRPSRSAIPADADHPFRQGDHPGR